MLICSPHIPSNMSVIGCFFFLNWILGENNVPFFLKTTKLPEAVVMLSCSRQENKMLNNKTSNKNSTWIEGGKWSGLEETWKIRTFFKGIIAHRSEPFSHTVAKPEMMERFVALVLDPVVNLKVEVCYQHDSKDLCSLLTNHAELEFWTRESFGYCADKIF